jgi:hypothetical protein
MIFVNPYPPSPGHYLLAAAPTHRSRIRNEGFSEGGLRERGVYCILYSRPQSAYNERLGVIMPLFFIPVTFI